MTRHLFLIAVLIGLPASSFGQASQLCPPGLAVEAGGCLAIGMGPGGVARSACAYEALDEEQTVVVATPNEWLVSVDRLCPEKPRGCTWTYSDGGCVPDPESTQGDCAPVELPSGDPSLVCRTVTLASGTGPPADLVQVHPEAGELVTVEFFLMFSGPATGSWGFMAAGVEDRP